MILPLETYGRRLLAGAEIWADRSPWRGVAFEFLWFGLKQAWACLFGGALLALIIGTYLFWPSGSVVSRYDFLVVGAVAIQALMLLFKLETWEEAKVIFLFHIAGTVMELFKTYHGSWIYPEDSLLRIGAVPLFSGFMYAAVGSYIARVQRVFHIGVRHYPPMWQTYLLAAAIYVNFFAHHWLPDVRIGLFIATALVFGRGWFWFKTDRKRRSMPLLLGYFLVALFIWIAENLATFGRAWTYPDQAAGWQMVSWAKFGSWFLLMIVSVVLVSLVHKPVPEDQARANENARR
ncbi:MULTISPECIES: DUF817 domain-containing protein [unclassified Brevundimonas]|uniref:DUF817 domain-containing protein n=1 Tax=unclassified Brevundimonas TaxID=2622653 RepID=UPI0025C08B1A|nr:MULTISPECIES: DUF817 domain-containing protein [unclassified Brevundimonas]